VLPWRRRHSHELRRIPSLRAHLEEERRTSSRRAHLICERIHGGGRAHCLRGGLSGKLRAHFHLFGSLLEEGCTKERCAPSHGGGRTCVEGANSKARGQGFHQGSSGQRQSISKAKAKAQGKRTKG
jgi:hypothetical protein